MSARPRAAGVVVALLLVGPGCGYEGDLPTPPTPPTPPVPPSQAALTLSLSSSPIDAVAGTEGGPAWSAQWTLLVRETAGVGGTIDFVRATLTDADEATVAEVELDAAQIGEQLGGSNHIRGGSNQPILMSLDFDFPDDTLSGSLHVSLQLTDERGNVVAPTIDSSIQVCALGLLSPPAGALLDNGCTNGQNGILWDFDWSDCAAAESYNIVISPRNAVQPFLDRRGLTSSSYSVLENTTIFEEARFGWTWKVRARLDDGRFGDWSPEHSFDVEPLNTDCPR